MASAKRELQVSVRVQGRQNAEVLGQRCTLLSSSESYSDDEALNPATEINGAENQQ